MVTDWKESIKATLRTCINTGTTIDELKAIVRELEHELTPARKGGRPLGVGNKGSQLDDHLTTISERLRAKDARGDIAASLGVSRQTLNEFIRVNLTEYHKPK
jgi:hypothetical protein